MLKEQKVKKIIIKDKIWFKRLKNLNKTYLSDVTLGTEELVVDYQNQSIRIKSKSKFDKWTSKKRALFFQHGRSSYQGLLKEVLRKEKNRLIKSEYVERIQESLLRLEIKAIHYKTNLSILEQNKKISAIHNELYPLPTSNDRELFINEFVDFLKFLENKNLFDINQVEFLDELFKTDFYGGNIILQSTHLDFGSCITSQLEYEEKKDLSLDEEISVEEIKSILLQTFEKLGISNEIKIKTRARKIFSVKSIPLQLTVPKRISITRQRLIEIISHEVMVHIMRSINGKNYVNEKGEKYAFLRFGKWKELYVEEGLATYFEQNALYQSNKYDIINLWEFYIRMIAVHLGLYFEPYEVFEKINKLYLLTAKIKGFTERKVERKRDLLMTRLYRDYKSPGKGCVNTKIAQYLYGNRKIWEYIEEGNDINRLFVGKVGFEGVK